MTVSIPNRSFLPISKLRNGIRPLVKSFLLLLFLTAVVSVQSFAQGFTTVDFNQAQNDRNGAKTYVIDWVSGILNSTHTNYFEGVGVPQRIVITGILANAANSNPNKHSLRFQILAEKNGKHTYDFPISWLQAQQTAGNIGNGSTNELKNLFTQECDPAFSSQGTAACNLLKGVPAANIKTPSFPGGTGAGLTPIGDPTGSAFGNVDGKINCFESIYGDRTLEIRGNAAISSAAISFVGYKGSGKNYAEYLLTWESASDKVMIRFAAHLSSGVGTCGYGAGLGAGSVSGGAYHVILSRFDDVDDPSDQTSEPGVSMGSQDNQIMSNAIQIPPNCIINGPAQGCAGTQAVFSTTPLSGETYAWSIINNTNTSTPASPPTPTSGSGPTFTITNIGTAGSFTVQLTVTGPSGVSTCTKAVTVNANPTASVNSPVKCAADPAVTITATPGSGVATDYNYAWTVPATVPAPGNVQSFTTSVAGIYSVVITNKTTLCVSPSANGTVTVNANPTLALQITEPKLCGTSPYGSLQVCSPKAGYTYQLFVNGNTTTPAATKTPQIGEAVIFNQIGAGSDPSIKVISSSADGSCPNTFACTSATTDACTSTAAAKINQTSNQTQATETITASIVSKAKTKAAATPNPFSSKLRFQLQSDISGRGTLELYNTLGQRVQTVFQGQVEAGKMQTIEYNVPSAQRTNLIYVFRVGDQSTTGKLIGMKQ